MAISKRRRSYEKKIKCASLTALMAIAGLCLVSFPGCSIFRATGEGVEALGQGTGTVIRGTGQAIVQGADDTENDIRRAIW
jgi:hypothetical protein